MTEHDVVLDEVAADGFRLAEREPHPPDRRVGDHVRVDRLSGHDRFLSLAGDFRWSTRTPSAPKSSSCHRSSNAVVSMSSGWNPGRMYLASSGISPLNTGPVKS